MKRLPRSFFKSPAEDVARALLGQELLSCIDDSITGGLVVETEAYLGLADTASHAFGGRRTKRTEALYREGGHAYVYLVYGMHWCLNITTGTPDDPTCVLIRALQPTAGIEAIRRRRGVADDRRLTDGPGKLCQALAVDGGFNGADLCGADLYFMQREPVPDARVERAARIGIDYAEPGDRDRRCRFFITGDPHVSKAVRRS